jgi:hypothetical protein
MITLTRKSIITGIERDKELPITWEQVHRWEAGELIQNVFEELSSADREFIMTGIVEEEWEKLSQVRA